MRLRKYVFPRLASERIKLDGDCHCQSIFEKFVASFYRLNPVNLCRKMIGRSHNPYVSARIFQRNPVHSAYRLVHFQTKVFPTVTVPSITFPGEKQPLAVEAPP